MKHRSRRRPARQFRRLTFQTLEHRSLLAASLVADLAPLGNANPHSLTRSGNTTFFVASDRTNGEELWKTDGTAGGTVLVRDIRSGIYGSSPRYLTDVNGTLYFRANDGTNGYELWKSDGTAAGTVLVSNINSTTGYGSYPRSLTNVNGTLFFVATDGSSGYELWKSNGSSATTVQVKDIRSGSLGSYPTSLVNLNGTLLFSAFDATNGYEIWKSDGSANGTTVLKDIRSGAAGSYPRSLTNVNGTVFFRAYDTTNGYELWKSNGTAAGTTLVKDLRPGSAGSYPSYFANVNGTLFFRASDGSNGYELWKSDGSSGGTMMVKDVRPGSASSFPGYLTNVNGTLFFSAFTDGEGYELWKSDGSAGGTVQVKDVRSGTTGAYPRGLTSFNNQLFFSSHDGSHGYELWTSDGTSGGTTLVSDLLSGGYGSYPFYLKSVNGSLFFRANDGTNGYELWKSDGTAGGTLMVRDIRDVSGSYPAALADVNGTLFFTANSGGVGFELWKSDGTQTGTTLIKDIRRGGYSSSPHYLTNLNGKLLFAATDGLTGTELWTSDGTTSGTTQVKDIRSGVYGANPGYFTTMNGKLFFVANDGTNGTELWVSDGTASGTSMVKDIRAGSTGSYPRELTNVNGTLYFRAYDTTNGYELWKSDGTSTGTTLVKDIRTGTSGSYPQGLTAVGSTLFFRAYEATNGYELWKSNGTSAGTVLVKNIRTGAYSSYPTYLTNVNGTLYFRANDGTNGYELWKSDGNATGTVMVANIRASSASSYPTNLTNFNGVLFFDANDGSSGYELWTSNGTTTSRLADINPGAGNSSPAGFKVFGGKLYFKANNGTSGYELWRTDGTAGGTFQVQDQRSGSTGSYPLYLTTTSTRLFFSTDDGVKGRELFSFRENSGTLEFDSATSTKSEDGGAFTVAVKLVTSDGLALDTPLTVQVAIASGTATNGVDLAAFSTTTLSFAHGDANGLTKTVTLSPTNDTLVEGSETFTLSLQNATGSGSINAAKKDHVVTLTDGDAATIQFAAATDSAAEATSAYSLPVKLVTSPANATLAAAVTVAVNRTGGTATSGEDFTAFTSQTLTFNAGSGNNATQNVSLTVTNDTLVEGHETLTFVLQNATGVATIDANAASHTTTITDNDSATLAIATTSTVNEDGGSQAINLSWNVTANGVANSGSLAPGITLTADVVQAGGTATSGEDYSPFGTQTISISASDGASATKTVDLSVLADNSVEGPETVLLVLQNLNNSLDGRVTLGNTANAATIADTLGPSADIVDVSPDPRRTGVGVVTVNFTRPVSGVDLADFTLTRDGTAVSLAGLGVTQVTESQYTLDLANVTGVSGAYVLRLTAAGSGIQDLAGNALTGNATDAWTLDTTAPTADIVDIVPDPRSNSVGVAAVNFSEAVTGVDVADFSLRRNGAAIGLAGLSLTQVSSSQYQLTLSSVTGSSGDYVLTLVATGSGIQDALGNTLAADATDAWTTDSTAPTADIVDVSPDPRRTGVGVVTVNFSEAVSGVDGSDFSLTRSGAAVSLNGLVVTPVSATQFTLDLSNLASASGDYLLTLKAAGSGITDPLGNALAVDATDDWTLDATAPTADIVDVSPDPRSTSVGAVTVNFSEPVTGVDLADFSLTRGGTAVDLSGLSLTTVSTTRYTLNLSSVTTSNGSYVVRVTAAGSGIADTLGNAFAVDATDAWTIDTSGPTADIRDVLPDPRNTGVGVVTVDFSRSVTGVDRGDFSLTRDGAAVSLSNLSVVTISATEYRLDLTNFARLPGEYVLTLRAQGSNIQDSVGNLFLEDATDAWTIDTTAPTADIVDISPDPRNTSVGLVTVNFSEPVSGVDGGDFTLLRSGSGMILSNVAITQVTPSQYTFTLSGLTTNPGNYVLTLVAQGSGIVDDAGNSLAADAVDEWTLETTRPTADIGDVTPDPRSTPVGVVTVNFTEPVTGVDLADFSLIREGAAVDLSGLSVTRVSDSQYTVNLTSVTGVDGAYTLRLVAAGSGIADSAGNLLDVDASDSWTSQFGLADDDGDNISNAVEALAPNNGDANRDGVADNRQANVTSAPHPDTGNYVTLAAPPSVVVASTEVDAQAPATGAPAGFNFAAGYVNFRLTNLAPGGSTVVTIYLDQVGGVNTFYKYGPTPDNATPHWYRFLFDGRTGAKLFTDRIEVHYVDGERGDDDLQANGVIVDAAAPAIDARTHPWQNPVSPSNVNDDGNVSALDALLIIAELNSVGGHALPPPVAPNIAVNYLDVNGDDQVTANDALQVINALSSSSGNRGAQAEPPVLFGAVVESRPADESADERRVPDVRTASATPFVVGPVGVWQRGSVATPRPFVSDDDWEDVLTLLAEDVCEWDYAIV